MRNSGTGVVLGMRKSHKLGVVLEIEGPLFRKRHVRSGHGVDEREKGGERRGKGGPREDPGQTQTQRPKNKSNKKGETRAWIHVEGRHGAPGEGTADLSVLSKGVTIMLVLLQDVGEDLDRRVLLP